MARRLFWVMFAVYVAMLLAARVWDSYWHTTHTFDGFFSPPHVFIYGTALVNVAILGHIVFTSDLRRWFGSGFKIPPQPFVVPGGLAVLGGAYILLAFVGLILDNLWHSRFGLDETMWSFPHAMLGWLWLLSLLGFVGCAIALHRHKPFFQHSTLLIGFFVIGLSASVMLGPFYQNSSPEIERAIASIPVLRSQPDAQHIFQIYLTWNLDRTSPLVAPFGALWVGAVMAFLRRLDRRVRSLLAATFLWTVVTSLGDYGTALRLGQSGSLAHNPSSWLPLPIFPTAIVLIIWSEAGKQDRWVWAVAGWVFGGLTFLFFGLQPLTALLALAAAPMAILGARLGEGAFRIIESPERADVVRLLMIGGVGVPMFLGVIDLIFRSVTARI